jgi:PAS domain S-box-containing protein
MAAVTEQIDSDTLSPTPSPRFRARGSWSLLSDLVDWSRSIAVVLQAVTIVLTVGLVGVFAANAVNALSLERQARRIPGVVHFSSDLFAAIQALVAERTLVDPALRAPDAANRDVRSAISGSRLQFATALHSALKIVGSSGPVVPDSALVALRQASKAYVETRRRVDAALLLPEDRRPIGLRRDWNAANSSYVSAIEALARQSERKLGHNDAYFGYLYQIERLASTLRSDTGYDRHLLRQAIDGETGPSDEESHLFALLDGRITANWEQIRYNVSFSGTPKRLLDAIQNADHHYFQPFGPFRNKVIEDLEAGKPLRKYKPQFLKFKTAGQGSIVAIANAAADLADAHASEILAAARSAFFAAVLLVATFSGIGAFMVLYVFRGVARPISRITAAVSAVAAGNLISNIPYSRRRDEIGLLARALASFRDHIIEKEALRAEKDRAASELAEAYEDLEERIERRTADLVREIHERTQVERTLRESDERYRTLAENVPGMVFQRVLHKDGTLEYPYMSGGVRRILGLDPQAIMAQPSRLLETTDPADQERFRAALASSAEALTPIDIELRHIRNDGKARWVRILSQPRRQGEESVVWDCIGVDTTDLRIATERNAQLESRIRQTEKMEALGTLAGGVAHELNNLLQPIIMTAEHLLEQSREGSASSRQLGHVISAGTKASDIVERILSFGRLHEPTNELLDIAAVVSDALYFIHTLLPSSITLISSIDGAVGTVRGDSTQLTQVIMNLATNARDAIGARTGTIWITLMRSDIESEAHDVHVGSVRSGAYAVLTIRDTGVGMDEATVKKIFDPFFTTKAVGEGTGLGLSVTHGIVIRHGGAIKIGSTPGEGTAFSIYLPLEEAPAKLEMTGT